MRFSHFVFTLRDFLADECGAVTVDWFVITAACAGLGLATAGLVTLTSDRVAEDTSVLISAYEIDAEFDSPDSLEALHVSLTEATAGAADP